MIMRGRISSAVALRSRDYLAKAKRLKLNAMDIFLFFSIANINFEGICVGCRALANII